MVQECIEAEKQEERVKKLNILWKMRATKKIHKYANTEQDKEVAWRCKINNVGLGERGKKYTE